MLIIALKLMVNKLLTCLRRVSILNSLNILNLADFESILVPEDNGKQNLNES